MTRALERLRHQQQATDDLGAIVEAMKSISAARMQRFRVMLETLDRHRMVNDRALQVALRQGPRRSPPTASSAAEGVDVPRDPGSAPWRPESVGLDAAPQALLAFGSDRGLVGGFNTRILEATVGPGRSTEPAAPAAHGTPRIIAVGARLVRAFERRGRRVDRALAAPGSVEGLAGVVQEVLLTCEHWSSVEGVRSFRLCYNHFEGGARWRTVVESLLPVDPTEWQRLREEPWPGPSLPIGLPDRQVLLRHLIRERLRRRLQLACAHSLMSENASRLAAMDAAEARIEQRRNELQRRLSRARQESITAELLDLLAGAEFEEP